jgi:hypothetical protein
MSFKLTHQEGSFLVRFARKVVGEYLKYRKTITAPQEISGKFIEKRGVFVTLNKKHQGKKELRGCIGFPYPSTPLIHALIESAINSATKDPRFRPLSFDELNHIVFEVSVLTSPEIIDVDNSINYPKKIMIGQDGLIVEKGSHKGLLLPQVPIEWKMEEEEFLCQCCMKAGLTPDCWMLKETKIYKFSCIIAQEITPNGEIELIDMRKS